MVDLATTGANRAFDNFAKTGEIDFSNVISSNDLKQANDPWIKAIGYAGDLVSGVLSGTKSEFYKQKVNVGAKDTGIIDSINALKNDVMINQLDTTREMLGQLEELNSQFRSVAVAVAPSGTYATPNADEIGKIEYNSLGTSLASGIQSLLGDNFASDILGGIATGLFGSSTKEIEHAGLTFGEQTVSSFIEGVNVQSYQDVKKTKKALFGIISSTSYDTEYQAVGEQVKKYFSDSVKLQVEIIKNSAKILNRDVSKINDKLSSVKINLGKFDFKGKSQDEIQSILQGAMSRQLGNIGRSLLPVIEVFKKQGETYSRTLIRVSSEYEKAKVLLKRVNVDIVDISQISKKNGDVLAESIRDSILRVEDSFQGLSGIGEIIKEMRGTGREIVDTYRELAHQQQLLRSINNRNATVNSGLISEFDGVSEFSNLQSNFYQNFVSDTQKILDLQDEVSRVTGANIPSTKEAYAQLVKNQDLSTKAGRERYAQLLREQSSFLTLIKLQEEARQKDKERLQEANQNIDEARTQEEDRIKRLRDAWIDMINNARDRIQGAIDSINSKYEKGRTGVVQQLSDLSYYKDKLQESFSTGNAEDIKRYSDRLAGVSQALASNGGVYKAIALRELTRVRDQLPKKKIQKVEIVNDERSEKILNTMYAQIGTQNNDNKEIIRLLGKIANELNLQTNKDEIKLIKGE